MVLEHLRLYIKIRLVKSKKVKFTNFVEFPVVFHFYVKHDHHEICMNVK